MSSSYLITSSSQEISRWDLSTNKISKNILEGDQLSPIVGVQELEKVTLLVSSGNSHHTWNTQHECCISMPELNQFHLWLSLIVQGDLVVGKTSESLQVWSLKSCSMVATRALQGIKELEGFVGNKVVYYDSSPTLYVWDIASSDEISFSISSLPFIVGSTLFVLSNDSLIIWDLASNTCNNLKVGFNYDTWESILALCMDGRDLLIGSPMGTIFMWDMGSWTIKMEFNGHSNRVRKVCMIADRVVSGMIERSNDMIQWTC